MEEWAEKELKKRYDLEKKKGSPVSWTDGSIYSKCHHIADPYTLRRNENDVEDWGILLPIEIYLVLDKTTDIVDYSVMSMGYQMEKMLDELLYYASALEFEDVNARLKGLGQQIWQAKEGLRMLFIEQVKAYDKVDFKCQYKYDAKSKKEMDEYFRTCILSDKGQSTNKDDPINPDMLKLKLAIGHIEIAVKTILEKTKVDKLKFFKKFEGERINQIEINNPFDY
ncbi:MAG: hypothetical protein FWG69_03720 [Oscillospiraceae bacterium]|nr:hypothetical protein [Oscillospiraceae bacterium]